MDNQKIAEILLGIEMDDLKDAAKLADCADKVKALGDLSVATALASRAKLRLSQVSECEHSIKSVMDRIPAERKEHGMYEDLLKKYVSQETERVRTKLEAM